MGLNSAGKIWGAHLVPTPTEVATGVAAWTNLFIDWDWAGWVKPQVDAAVAAGAACIGLIGCIDGVHATTISQATVNSRWVQLANYCQSLTPPVALYPKLCGYNQLTGCTNAEIATYVLSVLGAITSLVRVVGVDIIPESNLWNDGGGVRVQAVADRCNAIYTLVKAGTSLPCTYSMTDEWNGSTCRDWATKIDASCDYWDFHPYSMNGWATPINTADTAYWAGRDIYFGEGGSPQSDSIPQQNAFANGLGYLMYQTTANLRGWMIWSIADQDTVSANQFGMYNNSFVGRYNAVQTFKWYAAPRPSTRALKL